MDNIPNQQVPPAGSTVPVTPPQPTPYEELMKAKNFKSNDDVAKSYREAETELGRTKNAINTAKTQVEQQSQGSLTVDDKGNVIPKPGYTPQGGQHYGQPNAPVYQPQSPEQETIYDPYTGQVLSDPIQIQLARMLLGQREMFITNAVIEQRDKLQLQSYNLESEVLSSPDAKGFEADVKKVMSQVPLQYRADKKVWEDALLRVKGMKFDEMRKDVGGQAVKDFLNTQSNQGLPNSGGGASGSSLSPEMESSFQEYRKRFPNSKAAQDRNVFLQFTKPDAGRS